MTETEERLERAEAPDREEVIEELEEIRREKSLPEEVRQAAGNALALLRESDFDALCRILSKSAAWNGSWKPSEYETGDLFLGAPCRRKEITLREMSDMVTITFTEEGEIFG